MSGDQSSLGEFLLQEIMRTRGEAIEAEGFESVVITAWKELSLFMADFLGNALRNKSKINNGVSVSHPRRSTRIPNNTSGEDDKACSKCGKVFAKTRSRDFHESSCGSSPRVIWPSLKCPFCPLISDNFLRFKKHVQDCCPDKTKSLCPRCYKPITPSSSCNGSRDSHHPGCEYILKCVKCKFIAGHQEAYRAHYTSAHLLRTVSAHMCHECGKTFNRPSKLKSHSLVHNEEKVHQCEKCEKSFARLSGLREHQDVHKKENLPCEFCGKIYDSRRKLRIHQNSLHPGDVNRVECPHCDLCFLQHATFMQHVTSAHPVEVEQCGHCGITFTSKADFEQHGCEKRSFDQHDGDNDEVLGCTTIINVGDIIGGPIITE